MNGKHCIKVENSTLHSIACEPKSFLFAEIIHTLCLQIKNRPSVARTDALIIDVE